MMLLLPTTVATLAAAATGAVDFLKSTNFQKHKPQTTKSTQPTYHRKTYLATTIGKKNLKSCHFHDFLSTDAFI